MYFSEFLQQQAKLGIRCENEYDIFNFLQEQMILHSGN